LLEKAARQGHKDAQARLGTTYYKGEGVKRNYGTAERWYTKAAEAGQVNAQFSLGVLLTDDLNPHRNFRKALGWLTKAMANGHPEAFFLAGKIYYQGKTGAPDYARAERLFAEAKKRGGGKSDILGAEKWRALSAYSRTYSSKGVAEHKLTSSEAAVALVIGIGILAALNSGASGQPYSDNPYDKPLGKFGIHSDPVMDDMIGWSILGTF
jgi:TPR repeat protein